MPLMTEQDVEMQYSMQPSSSELIRDSEPNPDVDSVESASLLVDPQDYPATLRTSTKQYFWPSGIASLTVQTPDTRPSRTLANKPKHTRPAQPVRWKSIEFFVHYVIVGFGIWRMAVAPVRLSQESHPNYWIYERRLSPGWIPGRKVDNTDAQFRSFRNGFPSLVALASIYLVASKAYSLYLQRRLVHSSTVPATPHPRVPYQRIPFLLTVSLIVLFLLHGISSFKVFLILYLNFRIPDLTGNSKVTPYVIWFFNVGILFCNEIFNGYHFGSMWSALAFLDDSRIAGLKPGWHVNFNICMLRLVSFSMDRYWASQPKEGEDRGSSNDKNDYTWSNYLAYILYPPLFLAGPIITFTSFIDQVKKQPPIPRRAILAYFIRFIVCFLTMEIIMHYMYVVAIKDSYATHMRDGKNVQTRAWTGDTPFELAMISFWNLVILWLKLLLPWRFFRLWSLMDGIDPPENMIRCVLNNYSTRGFWRSWHRSYNLWLLRYLYVPVVSASNVLVATLLVFTFVALWHDLSLHLLAWGWLITLFVLPEMVALKVLPEEKYGHQPWYRHVCAIGGLFNILMMINANTIGFVLGVDHTVSFLKQVLGTWSGILFLAQACVVLFSASHLMFEYREEELRRNIVRKC